MSVQACLSIKLLGPHECVGLFKYQTLRNFFFARAAFDMGERSNFPKS